MNNAYLHKHLIRQIRINFGMFCLLMFLLMMNYFDSNKHQNIQSILTVVGGTLVAIAIFYFTYYKKEKKAFKKMLNEVI